MSKNLIVVESPNKIKTIQNYVGNDYKVIATYGHFRELNKRLGYDEDFNPRWSNINRDKSTKSKDKINITKFLKNDVKNFDNIYLATDPDREGEAISWHVWDIIPDEYKAKCKRITFNEVTKTAIQNAINNAGEINWDLVYSQFARRILDRMIGYKLSNFTKKMLKGKSAGRVQSVALLFIVERELERRNFVPSSWWELEANLLQNSKIELKVHYVNATNEYEPYEKVSANAAFKFAKEVDVNKVYQQLSKRFVLVQKNDPKHVKGDSYHPLTTDKLLQLAASQLGWTSSKTTFVAQKMFEGVEINNNQIALISYPRTDSERLSEEFVSVARKFIEKNYGNKYQAELKKQKVKNNVQDAHEAIRPIDPFLEPKTLKGIDNDVYKLYNLIWNRTIASLMQPPVFLIYGTYFDNNGHSFYTSHKAIEFDGYLILEGFKKVKAEYEKAVPTLNVGQVFEPIDTDLVKHDKAPPPYYTEATLIAALKEAGVGRPSTYSSMARISSERGYVVKEDKKLIPNETGINVIEALNKYFNVVISKEFTSSMETDLDQIAEGKKDWKTELREFKPMFEQKLNEAYEVMEPIKNEVFKDKKCPKCAGDLEIKLSRYGTKFLGCANFPNCKYAEPFEKKEIVETELKCPECQNNLLIRLNKRKQKFLGCSNFPKCKYAASYDEVKK